MFEFGILVFCILILILIGAAISWFLTWTGIVPSASIAITASTIIPLIRFLVGG